MKLLLREFRAQWFYPIVLILLVFIIFLSIWFFSSDAKDEKINAILSGLITGFVALLLQLWFSWVELNKLKKFDELKIINILATRDDPEYYRPLIKSAKRDVIVLGVTCLRFLQDFADDEASAPNKNKVLLESLDNKKIKVKLLVADESVLDNQDDKAKAKTAKPRLERLRQNYPNQFFYSYYTHIPAHSVMIIDDESIVGPIFPDVSSRYSPAIHLKNDSKFVEHYREYFNKEWDECSKR